MNPCYFDHNATTPLLPQVKDCLDENWEALNFNPSSSHKMGLRARQLLIQSTRTLETILGAGRDEIIFTSGATESCNHALTGIYFNQTRDPQSGRPLKNQIIATPDNHNAVKQTLKYLEAIHGAEIYWLKLDRNGQFDPQEVEQALNEKTLMLSLMTVNNETGIRSPYKKILNLLKEKNVLLHLDATQTVGRDPFFRLNACGGDLVSFSGHKCSALKGVGALYVRSGLVLEPLVHGGTQQIQRRGGTENLVGIYSMAKALEVFAIKGQQWHEDCIKMRTFLEQEILRQIPDCWINGIDAKRASNTVNVGFKGIEGHTLLMALDLEGFYISYGSACSSGSLKPSAILLAMGLSETEAGASVRLSLSHKNTLEECQALANTLAQLVKRHRELNPC